MENNSKSPRRRRSQSLSESFTLKEKIKIVNECFPFEYEYLEKKYVCTCCEERVHVKTFTKAFRHIEKIVLECLRDRCVNRIAFYDLIQPYVEKHHVCESELKSH